jgi:hypothetical protein
MIAKTKTKSKSSAKSKTPVREKPKSPVREKATPVIEARAKTKTKRVIENAGSGTKVHVVNKISPPRVSANGEGRKFTSKGLRLPQFAYMKAPGLTHDFQVGDTVEVYCDHEKSKDRVRGWIGGIVVQVDNKMVAVQFRSNVFLTDGWMVPDRILWYPLNSEHIRPVVGKKSVKREKAIPDY